MAEPDKKPKGATAGAQSRSADSTSLPRAKRIAKKSASGMPPWLGWATLAVAVLGLGAWGIKSLITWSVGSRVVAHAPASEPPAQIADAESDATDSEDSPSSPAPPSDATNSTSTDPAEGPAKPAADNREPPKPETIFELIQNNRDAKQVKALIARGLNVNERDGRDRTPLEWAARAGRADLVELLLAAKADPNASDSVGATALMLAVEKGDAKLVARMLEAGATVNAQTTGGARRGLTPLLIAARAGNAELVTQLLAAGAKVDQPNIDGVTPLMVAIWKGHSEVVKSLFVNGLAKADTMDRSGQTTLMYAAVSGKPEFVKMLIERGANINAKNSQGATALSIAEINRDEAMIAALKEELKKTAPEVTF